MVEGRGRTISLGALIPFLMELLTRWAAGGTYGEIRIVVQGGQIEFVHESVSFRGTLPKRSGPGAGKADIVAGQPVQR